MPTVPLGNVAGDNVIEPHEPVTVRTPLPVANCPSGLVTVTFFAPAVAPTVETLIVMCGEMGRTPRVNAGGGASGVPGRDHWGAVQTVFVAGGGIKQGVVVGASDRNGASRCRLSVD